MVVLVVGVLMELWEMVLLRELNPGLVKGNNLYLSSILSSYILARVVAWGNVMVCKACTYLWISGFNQEVKKLSRNGYGRPTMWFSNRVKLMRYWFINPFWESLNIALRGSQSVNLVSSAIKRSDQDMIISLHIINSNQLRTWPSM